MVMLAHASGYRSISALCKPQNPKLLSQRSLVGFTLLFQGQQIKVTRFNTVHRREMFTILSQLGSICWQVDVIL